ncbi:MAG: serine/threonine-protein kinase [Bdellovibrionota bacterium]
MGEFEPKFFGPYYLVNQIGKGGTAEVYLAILGEYFDAKHPQKSMYALKRLLPKLSKEKSFVQCLTSEAKVASILQHPNIVSVSDLGNVGTDYYLSMEWINGKSLFDVLKTVKTKKKAISNHYLLYICYEISKGLNFAHQAKDQAGRALDIVHCDISPHNILVSYSGKVKLSDFGIATAAKQKEQIVGSTVFGKIHYIAPEQISHSGFDYRADIYSFGVLLYESLTFQKPFRAQSQIELQNKIRTEAPSFSDEVFWEHKKIKEFVQACLEKDPNNRPENLEVFQTIYADSYADKEVDQKKIGRLMQHLFREVINEEKSTLKKAVDQFKKELKEKEKLHQDSRGPKQEQDIVDHTEVLTQDPTEQQTKILRKDEPKEGLGKLL